MSVLKSTFSLLKSIPMEVILVAIALLVTKAIFNIMSQYYIPYSYRNEDREKNLERKHAKLKKIVGDEEEMNLIEDLIASKIKSEGKSKLFCDINDIYDIMDRHLTEEILNRESM